MSSRLPHFLIAVLTALAACTTASSAQPTSTPGGHSATEVYTVVDTLLGAVGGVAVDRLGDIYVADFGESVWKIKPDGRRTLFAAGLYGASGNTVSPHGDLYQSSFYGNYVTRIDRHGRQEIFVSEGLSGPVGVTFDSDGYLYVNNCTGNSITRVTPAGSASIFAESTLLNCPNGIVGDGQGNLYVVNFRDERVLKVTSAGRVTELASLPGGGNGHVTWARGTLYATSFRGHRVYSVSPDGVVGLVAGTGTMGESDGPGSAATFSWPNGIAAGPNGDRLYVNDYLNRTPPSVARPPVPLSSVRMIKLASISDVLLQALEAGGVSAMGEAYRRFKSDPSTSGLYTEFDVNGLGYRLLGSGQSEAAIEVFKLNITSYPASFNVYDSLAEAYVKTGERDMAVEFYRKSLELNSANENARQMLVELGAE